MLSRWNMAERASKNHGLLQVQYAFLELPKMPDRRPVEPGADLWAWLFVNAPDLTEVPADLTPGPYGDALELASKAKLTVAELQASPHEGSAMNDDPFEPDARAEEKQRSRDQDRLALERDEKTADDLRRENGLFVFPRVRIDLDGAESLS